jgi:CDP-diacylglycerol--glycerol-3-phosphate 3-phosphatidyltransferase
MKSLPNALALFRMAAGPVVAGLILRGDHLALSEGLSVAAGPFIAAFVIFVLAALSDAADGILARKLNAVSTLGAALDHAADKVLTSCVLIALAITSLSTDLIVAAILIIARDAAIGGVREGLALAGKALPVSKGGKLKTILVLVGAGLAIATQTVIYINSDVQLIIVLDRLTHGVLWAGGAVALWTGIAYLAQAFKTSDTSPTE